MPLYTTPDLCMVTIMQRASLPLFFRTWITKHYGDDVIMRIDRAGKFHDELMGKYPRSAKHNRRRFKKHLNRLNVPGELVCVIICGLFVYDISPASLKRLFKKSAGETYTK